MQLSVKADSVKALGVFICPVEVKSDGLGMQDWSVGAVAMWWTTAEGDIVCRLSWHRLTFP